MSDKKDSLKALLKAKDLTEEQAQHLLDNLPEEDLATLYKLLELPRRYNVFAKNLSILIERMDKKKEVDQKPVPA